MRHWITALALGICASTAQAASLDQPHARALAQEAYVFAYATGEHFKVLGAIAAKFGDDDLTRAAVAWRYIYANDPVEAMYPLALHDA